MPATLTHAAAEVNPASIDAALIDAYLADLATAPAADLDGYSAEVDAAYDAWLDANADGLAADSEADDAVCSGHWAW